MQTEERAALAGELDLISMLRSLWQQRFLIVGVVALVVLSAVGYLLVASPVYESRVYLAPPTQNDIANFNYGRTSEAELRPYTVGDVYTVFLANLRAESLRRDFFRTVYLPSLSDAERSRPQDQLYADFLRHMSIEQVSADTPDRYVFSMRAESVEQAVAWGTDYVRRAGEAGLNEMIRNVTSEVEVRARNLNQQINTLRENGRKVREDRIVRLREALQVAQAINLSKPPLIGEALSREVSAAMGGDLTYMRGSEALNAEIDSLERRSSDDPFLPQLRQLQVRHDFFKNLEVSPDRVAVYRIDGELGVPDTQISPRSSLVLTLAVLAGLVLGLGVALARFVIPAAFRQHERAWRGQ